MDKFLSHTKGYLNGRRQQVIDVKSPTSTVVFYSLLLKTPFSIWESPRRWPKRSHMTSTNWWEKGIHVQLKGRQYVWSWWLKKKLWRKQRHAFACFVVADRRSVSICIVLLDHVHQFDREASHIDTPNQKPGDVVKLLCKIFM